MKPLRSFKPPTALLAGVLCLLLGAGLFTGSTAARYMAEYSVADTAQTAAFDVQVLPPPGIYTSETLAGGERNGIYQTNTERCEQVFTVVNHSEVTVKITPAVLAQTPLAWSMDTTPFLLGAGEQQELLLVLEGGGAALTQTVEDIDLVLTIEQVD